MPLRLHTFPVTSGHHLNPNAPRNPKPLANQPARLFQALYSTWHYQAASEQVDQLAAELAARVARASAPLCLAVVYRREIASFFGLVYLLDTFGLTLRKRYRHDGDSAFIFIERRAEAPSEFSGAVVRPRKYTHRSRHRAALPRAA